MLAKLTSHFSGVTSSEMAFQELIPRHFGRKDAKMKPGICIFNTHETITADVRQPWTNLHDCYFEYLIIRFDYLIIPFDYLIIG